MLRLARGWLRRDAGILLLFVGFTIVVTYPQVRGLATLVPYHTDPYFAMWRLGWVAHALTTSPGRLFDANIFYPASHTLGYADAMLFQGAVAAPLFWAHVNPVLIYNTLLLAAFALSGYATYVLARHVSGNNTGAMVAGLVYAFAPYRFSHYMHLELQTMFWVPLALLLIHRLAVQPRWLDGVLLGVTITAQLLSDVYVCVYSLVYLATVAPVLLVTADLRRNARTLAIVTAGAALTLVVAIPYMRAYQQAGREVGMRTVDEVSAYSASWKHYLAAPAWSRMYGWTARNDPREADEMSLFPGVLVTVFALAGIIAGRGRSRLAYVVGLAVAAELSRGSSSGAYLWLFRHVETFQAFRSPARFDGLVNLSLGILGAIGIATLLARVESGRWRRPIGAVIVTLTIVEYAASPALAPVPGPTHVDSALARRPPAVIVELPLQVRGGFWGSFDWLYEYESLPHLDPMLNGYSGHAPHTFFEMRDVMAAFPDSRSIDFLRRHHVEYVVVRAGLYEPAPRTELLARLDAASDLSLEGKWPEGSLGEEALYRLKPAQDH
jgi:hypothetical protein